jgi:non-specific serine/threonine protein kinase
VVALGWQATLAGLGSHFRLLDGQRHEGPLRQRSLRACFDWSHALLPPLLQAAWQALSVLPERWQLAHAQAVLGPDLGDEVDVLAALAELEQRSLILREAGQPTHWRLPAAQRQDAAERLQFAGRASLMAERLARAQALLDQA